MINTNCAQCMFANQITPNNIENGCSKKIVSEIKNDKLITQDDNNYNIIHNYACRFGFSKDVYEKHKDQFDGIDLNYKIQENAKLKYYLLLDCIPEGPDIDHIIEKLHSSYIQPTKLSLMFRSLNNQHFSDNHKDLIPAKLPNTVWKIHNFLHELDIQEAVDHVLSTNLKTTSQYILVYKSSDLDNFISNIDYINNSIILHQKPNIAMMKSLDSIYGLVISIPNYNMAKSIDNDVVKVLADQQSQILQY